MLKKTIIVGVSIVALSFAGAAFATGNGAETLELKGGKLGDVHFPHKTHQDILKDCQLCHTLFPQEADAIQQGIAADKLKKKEVMKVCVKCHKEHKKEGTATGPTSCKKCHQK